MERSNSQAQAQAQVLFNFPGGVAKGFRLSSKFLGIGVLLLAMEAPVLAQLSEAQRANGIEAPVAETELIEALANSTAPALTPASEAAASKEIDALAEAMADAVSADEPSLEVTTEPGAVAETIEGEASDVQPAMEKAEALANEAPGEATEAIAEPAEILAEDEAASSRDAIETDSIEASDAELAEVKENEAGDESSEIAAAEEPIPTLAERCAAPEATLFPPEPEVVEDGEPGDEGDEAVSAGDEGAIAETPVDSENQPSDSATANPETANPETANLETTSNEANDLETATETSAEATETETKTDAPEEVAVVEPDTAIEDLDPEAKAAAAARAAREKELVCALYKADQQYQAGQLAEAKVTYQLAKDPFAAEAKSLATEQKPALTDPEALSAGGRVFLREAAAGREQNLETRTLVPLELLVQQHPEFIPGQVQLAEALVKTGRSEEALARLAEASGRYPNEPELLKAHIALASEQGEWMDAVMVARRFAQLNPDHPQAAEFVALAEENMALFQGDVRDRLRANTIANVLTGAVSVALTGSIWNSLSSIQTTTMMLRGEEGVGNGISKSIKRQVELVEDEEIVNYIQTMGEELVAVAGRDEFDYEFNILMDPNLNAFALPGGKIFVNAGAIAKTKSKAELAGLLSHELAHAVLSHGFQLVSDGSLLSDLSRFVPYGGYASNLVVLNYSRDMEREADELGARIASAAGYAADGLHGLMKTLGEQDTRRPLFAWMSTHPETDERVGNLEKQISQEGLNRYQFEGVEEHFRMRVKVKRLIEEWKVRKAKEAEERPWWR